MQRLTDFGRLQRFGGDSNRLQDAVQKRDMCILEKKVMCMNRQQAGGGGVGVALFLSRLSRS